MKIVLSREGIALAYLQTVFPKENFVCIENFGDEGISIFEDKISAPDTGTIPDYLIAPLRPTTKAAEPILADKWIICYKVEIPAHEDEQAYCDFEEFRSIEWLAATKYLKRHMTLPPTQIFDGFEQAACCLPVVVSQLRIIEATSRIAEEKYLSNQKQ